MKFLFYIDFLFVFLYNFPNPSIYSTIRMEVITMIYTPLYVQTDGSLLHSMIGVDTLIDYAKEKGIKALSITDSTMYNVIEFYEKCLKNQIKPIIGLEIVLEEKACILYALDVHGYQNLLKLATLQSERILIREDLQCYSDGILAILPYPSKDLEIELQSIYKMIWIGYTNKEEKECITNQPVYMKKSLYTDARDKEYLPYLNAIQKGILAINSEVDAKDYMLSLDENLFCENNYKIYELCHVEIPKENNLLPIYTCPDDLDHFSYLKKLCIEGMRKIFGQRVAPIYVERLKYELSVIQQMNFCNYFLVVFDYVKYAKEHDILVGPGRGSAAGSLVSYFLDITEIDPIRYNLLFERFLNPERITMPDIDIDFEDVKRDEIIAYCTTKYGMKKVAPIITFGTMKSRQALRDVGRCMDIDLKTIDMICHLIDTRISLLDNYNQNEKLKKVIQEDIELQKVYKIAMKFEGLKRHTSIHAAGVVMSRLDLDEIIPLDKNHDAFYTTGYSMEYLESLGLLKMDFLALTTLTTLHEMVRDINMHESASLAVEMIPENDEKTLELFESVNTVGIFQFESEGMKNFLRKFKPNTFEDIVSAIALYRPGPMDNIDSYIARKRGEEKIDYLHENLIPILKPTYGVIVYQEQIMQIANVMAGYSYAEADLLRRAMSKKKAQVLLEEKDKFVERSSKSGYEKEIATKVYDLILKFASYGFNRAHSVSYSMISYRLAYIKSHYPAYFMRSLLGSVIGNENKTKEYIYACKMMGIDVSKPSISRSGKGYKVDGKDIIFPLTGIKNVGLSSVTIIMEEREKAPFKDLFDFMARCYSKSINKKVLEAFIYAGAFEEMGYTKKTLIGNVGVLINYAEIARDLSYEFALTPELIHQEEYSKNELMQKELDVFGFYLSNHPVSAYNMKHKEIIPLQDIALYFDKVVPLIVYVDRMKNVVTKKGDTMCFITGSDEITNIDVVLFPRIYMKYPSIKVGDILYIKGKVEKRFDKYQIIVNELRKLEDKT